MRNKKVTSKKDFWGNMFCLFLFFSWLFFEQTLVMKPGYKHYKTRVSLFFFLFCADVALRNNKPPLKEN